MNIGIIEDEGITALFLEETVTNLNHNVVGIYDNGKEMLDLLETNSDIDLFLLDINIKGSLSGIETAKKILAKFPDKGVVFITSYKDSATIKRVKTIKPLGYLIKPVMESDIEASLMIAEASLEGNEDKEKIKIVDDFIFFPKMSLLMKGEETISLTEKELICLKQLCCHGNAIVSSEQLINSIWNQENGVDRISSLRELIYRLRKKIPNLPLTSTSKVGYLLKLS